MFDDKGAEPFTQLPRLGSDDIERPGARMFAKMRGNIGRHRMGLFQPREKVAAVRQPLDLAASGRSDAVEKIEREIIADKKWRGTRNRHSRPPAPIVPNRSQLRNLYFCD